MIVRAPAKCFSIFIVIFLMCPKRSRLSVPIGNQPEYYHAVRRSSMIKLPDNEPLGLRTYLHPVIHATETENDLPVGQTLYETGFDLTDEEIVKFKLWDKGVVPYYIDVPSFTDKVLRDRIRWFLNMVNSVTSLNFIELPRPPVDEQTRWVFFINRRGQLGCADHSISNFTTQGVQRVVLGYDCMATGGELAETVLSIAGVPPQHNAPNRDKYIKIIDENISPEKKYLFKKLKNTEWLFHDIEYDFTSASHFHHHRHSANGRATIVTKKPTQGIHVEKRGFSSKDILKIKMLYNYIVTKKKSKNKVSACNKLFSPGKKLMNIRPDYIHQKEHPRPKPKKYLGDQGDSDNDADDDDADGKSSEVGTLPAKLGKSSTKDQKIDIDSTNKDTPGFRSQMDENYGRHKNQERPQNKQPPMKHYYKDPLTYLSDYETGDENYQRSILMKSDYNGFGKMTEYWKKKIK